ncbi:MAG: hypothetical protein RQ733_04850 [Methyloprofundus sp.]|nr:hypothetical protein [Methyloprofundus sp.]MDT8425284.1 hypothetical protein [Methyloprofundus sp.]
MIYNNFRQKSRRRVERRTKERRTINAAFNSIEWIKSIRDNYFLWPKKDRRKQDRRHQGRRQNLRRGNKLSHSTASMRTKKSLDLLTDEEKKMLSQLTNNDSTI